jgi:hypothetical protein
MPGMAYPIFLRAIYPRKSGPCFKEIEDKIFFLNRKGKAFVNMYEQ